MVTVIIGTQWGDEGKGKFVDFLATSSDFVARFNGGNNAGHTISNEFGTFPLHLVPAGIFHKKATSLITNGVVIDLEVLVAEIESLEKAGIQTAGRLFISPSCHIIMPYHKILDGLYEAAKGKGKIGTTGRGIGPVYADKVSYNGIRMEDFLEKSVFEEKVKTQLEVKNKIIQALGGTELSLQGILKTYEEFAKKLKPYVRETFTFIQEAIAQKKDILLEGAQAVFLDNNWGTYPYVTASTVVSGGATSGAGIAPNQIGKVIGIAKAYATRVGEGPFPTEAEGKDLEQLRKVGNEFGTTTGRPRRCGWFDAEMVRFAVKLNGISEIVITKLDVLDGFETIKICKGYTLDGKPFHYTDGGQLMLKHVEPIFAEMKGWNTSTRDMKNFDDLPREAREYIQTIEELIGARVSYISNGPKRNEIIKR